MMKESKIKKPGKLYFFDDGSICGYDIEDIKKFLGSDRAKEFSKWHSGQTGAIIGSKFIVYKWDWEQFMADKPDLDGGAYG